MDNVFGFVPSKLDGTEAKLSGGAYETLPLPKAYSYLPYMSDILDQGQSSTCVPHAISAAYDYYLAVKNPANNYDSEDGNMKNSGISIWQIYNSRTNYGDGMSYKDALSFCLTNGVVTDKQYRKKDFSYPIKISNYAIIPSLRVMKASIIMNGPCMIATLVKSLTRDDFWNGYENYGGHATCVIGYDDDKEALLIRNSWGTSFGDNGYVWMPYKDFNKIIEAWAILM